MSHLAKDAVINLRSNTMPNLVIDGEEFPFYTDKKHGVTVQVNDDNVHLVIIAIQVDRSVTIIDRSLPEGDY